MSGRCLIPSPIVHAESRRNLPARITFDAKRRCDLRIVLLLRGFPPVPVLLKELRRTADKVSIFIILTLGADQNLPISAAYRVRASIDRIRREGIPVLIYRF